MPKIYEETVLAKVCEREFEIKTTTPEGKEGTLCVLCENEGVITTNHGKVFCICKVGRNDRKKKLEEVTKNLQVVPE